MQTISVRKDPRRLRQIEHARKRVQRSRRLLRRVLLVGVPLAPEERGHAAPDRIAGRVDPRQLARDRNEPGPEPEAVAAVAEIEVLAAAPALVEVERALVREGHALAADLVGDG